MFNSTHPHDVWWILPVAFLEPLVVAGGTNTRTI
jgi:hypothetical protein